LIRYNANSKYEKTRQFALSGLSKLGVSATGLDSII